jgi:hypothetical protein
MEQYYSLEEITDKYIGVKGSAERESFEADVEAELTDANGDHERTPRS